MKNLINEILMLANPDILPQISQQNKINNSKWYEENEKFIASIKGKKTTNIKVTHDNKGNLIKIIGNKTIKNPVMEF